MARRGSETWPTASRVCANPRIAVHRKRVPERFAIDIFIDELNRQSRAGWHAKRFQLQERPDAVLEDARGNHLGVEITHAVHDSEEAKMLLGRSLTDFSGLQSFDELLDVIKDRVSDKERKVPTYGRPYPISLIVRVASPVFTVDQFIGALARKELIVSKGSIHEVWILVRNDDDTLTHSCLRIA